MKNAAVIGATTHVGFALCKKLIQHEVEVTGFEWSGKMDGRAHDMVMEIGRNSFFHLQLDQPLEDSVDVAFFFLDRKEILEDSYRTASVTFAENAKKLILVSSCHSQKNNSFFKDLLKKKLKNFPNKSCISIYLPMVIGPWQGVDEAVQRRLQEELSAKELLKPISIVDRDVLFVDDVATAIYNISRDGVEGEDIRLKNKNPLALQELTESLNLTFLKDSEHVSNWDNVTDYEVKQSLSIKESLQIQRDQIGHKMKLD